LLKIYTLPNHTITIGVCILETQLLGLLHGRGTSFVQKWFMPWMSANIQVPFLYSLISMDWGQVKFFMEVHTRECQFVRQDIHMEGF
jgi:hypothetical protein